LSAVSSAVDLVFHFNPIRWVDIIFIDALPRASVKVHLTRIDAAARETAIWRRWDVATCIVLSTNQLTVTANSLRCDNAINEVDAHLPTFNFTDYG
jgi:hypothetical protein